MVLCESCFTKINCTDDNNNTTVSKPSKIPIMTMDLLDFVCLHLLGQYPQNRFKEMRTGSKIPVLKTYLRCPRKFALTKAKSMHDLVINDFMNLLG
ncbi:unnamed protein product, partial [Mesorhabditis spiculigera]